MVQLTDEHKVLQRCRFNESAELFIPLMGVERFKFESFVRWARKPWTVYIMGDDSRQHLVCTAAMHCRLIDYIREYSEAAEAIQRIKDNAQQCL
jgi:hypothetical protein